MARENQTILDTSQNARYQEKGRISQKNVLLQQNLQIELKQYQNE